MSQIIRPLETSIKTSNIMNRQQKNYHKYRTLNLLNSKNHILGCNEVKKQEFQQNQKPFSTKKSKREKNDKDQPALEQESVDR